MSKRNKVVGGATGLAAVIAAAVAIPLTLFSGTPTTYNVLANVFVAIPKASGGLGSSAPTNPDCKRFDVRRTEPPGGIKRGCADPARAYSLAQPGDVIAWQPGSYNAQTLSKEISKASTFNGAAPLCRAAATYPDGPIPVNYTGCITNRSAVSGQVITIKGDLTVAVPYLRVVGFHINGQIFVGANLTAGESCSQWNVTDNVFDHVTATSFQVVGARYAQFVNISNIGDTDNFGSVVKPCSDGTIVQAGNNFLSQGTRFHDVHQTQAVSDLACLKLSPTSNSTIDRTKFFNCGQQDLLVKTSNGLTQNGLLLQNSFFDIGCSHPLGGDSCSVANNGQATFNCATSGEGLTGVTMRFNSFSAAGEPTFLKTGTCTTSNFDVHGNILAGPVSAGACTTQQAYGITYRYNMFFRGFACGSNNNLNTSAANTYVDASNYDYRLKAAAPEIDYVPTNVVGGCSPRDIYGKARPLSTACDAGAWEYPGTVSPPPPGNTTPAAASGAVTTPKNTPITIMLSGGDPDTGDCELTFTIVTQPVNGSLGAFTYLPCTMGPQNDTGTIVYTPSSNFVGTDVLTFRVWDGLAGSNANVNITVTNTAPADVAPTVFSTSPSNGSVNNAINSNVAFTFSEAVNVTGSWYSISCGISGAHAAVVSGGPTTYTLNPSIDFANSETCTVTITATLISDQDANDPPDNMVSNYSMSFNTVSNVQPPSGFNLYVNISAGGSPQRCASTCVYDPTKAYGSFASACTAALAGDAVGVKGGSYGVQTMPTAACNPSSTVTFQGVAGEMPVVQGLFIGQNNGGVQPGNLTFNNMNFTGSSTNRAVFIQSGSTNVNTAPHDINFNNDLFAVGQPTIGRVFIAYDIQRLRITNSTFGPACCGLDNNGSANESPVGITLAISDVGHPSPTDAVIDNNTIQYITRHCSDWPTSGWGACPQASCFDTVICHADGIHIWGETNITITRNKIIGDNCQAIFIENDVNGSTNNGATIENNMIGDVTSCSTAGISFRGNGTPGTTAGIWNIRFNSGRMSIIGPNGCGSCAPGTTFNMTGNAMDLLLTNSNGNNAGCQNTIGNGTFNWRYNVWRTDNPGGTNAACSATDSTGNTAFVNANGGPSVGINLSLTGANGPADNKVPTNVVGGCPITDLFGTLRPQNANCDAGAHERNQ